jgi:hypothetical protein
VTTAVVVGAVTAADAKLPESSFGSCVNIWAPGRNILSLWSTSDTATASRSGTSMAAPHVSGALALMLARPGWATRTPAQLMAQLLADSTPGVITGLDANSPNKLVYTSPPPIGGGSSVALGRHADGRLALFGVNNAGSLFVRSQISPNSSAWTPWATSVDPGWYSVCADTDGAARVKLVGLRRNYEPWHRSQAAANVNSWTIWQKFDGLLNACAVISNGASLHVFGTNGQGQLWRRSEVLPGAGVFTPWSLVAGIAPVRAVAAERNFESAVQVFGLTRAGQIWYCSTQCAAGGWSQLDGLLSTIAVTRNVLGALTLFGVNSAGQLFSRDAVPGTSAWTAWMQLDVPAAVGVLRSVAAEINADGRIELVAVNTGGQIWRRSQIAAGAPSYGTWTQLDGLLRP